MEFMVWVFYQNGVWIPYVSTTTKGAAQQHAKELKARDGDSISKILIVYCLEEEIL